MVVIELFVYVSIISMMVVCINVIRKRGLVKKSDFIFFCVMLSLLVTQIFIQISPAIRNSIHYVTSLCIGTILVLILIYFITRIKESSIKIQEDARVWIGWTMFLVLVASICALLIGLPDTKIGLYRMPFALTLCIGMKYYPSVLDKLTRLKDAADQQAIEKSVEGHKEAVINLAIESWRFAKNYERMIKRLDTNQTQRYTRQLQQFVKKAEESLADVGLRVVNVEGYPYDPGMAATPLNIEDFEPDEHLVVDQMLEPIIMEGTALAKTGTVTLRRKK